MTEVGIQEILINRFKELNEFSGINFLTDNNVMYPNQVISIPADKRWFELYFMSNEPKPITAFNDEYGLNSYTGYLQIDICTPLDKGEIEPNTKYEWLNKLFKMGDNYGDVSILSCQRIKQTRENDHYVTKVKVSFEAVTDR